MQSTPYIWNYLPLRSRSCALRPGRRHGGASFLIGKHKNSRTKLDTYECGMEPIGDARGRFSVRFYMVAMLFILFDVEAVFMLPWAVIYRDLPRITAPGSSASGRCWSTSASSVSASSMSGKRRAGLVDR